MIAHDVIERCRVQLKDTAGALRWPDSELFLWLRDGVDLIGNAFPAEAMGDLEVLTLANDTRQVIPNYRRTLVRLERNLDGEPITRVDRYASNVMRLVSTPDGPPIEYWQDEGSDAEFWVYPKPPAGHQVEAYLSHYQKKIQSLSTTLIVPDAYRSALVDYVMSAAISKDAEYADNLQLAVAWSQSFQQKTGIKLQGDSVNPLPVTGQE